MDILNEAHSIIKDHFEQSIIVKQKSLVALSSKIAMAAQACIYCLLNEKKILVCGNGGSAADAQHFSAELLNRFEMERPALPAIALTTDTSTITAIGNDYNFNEIFVKQIQALGQAGDILIAISTSGNSKNVNLAINAAKEKSMQIIGISGNNGGEMANLLSDQINLIVPAERTAYIQETHIIILHLICALIDKGLFGDLA